MQNFRIGTRRPINFILDNYTISPCWFSLGWDGVNEEDYLTDGGNASNSLGKLNKFGALLQKGTILKVQNDD